MEQQYYPEMGQKKPITQVEAHTNDYQRWLLKTPLELPTSASVKFVKTFTADDLTPQAQHKVGWHQYYATKRGYEMICKEYSVALECLLD